MILSLHGFLAGIIYRCHPSILSSSSFSRTRDHFLRQPLLPETANAVESLIDIQVRRCMGDTSLVPHQDDVQVHASTDSFTVSFFPPRMDSCCAATYSSSSYETDSSLSSATMRHTDCVTRYGDTIGGHSFQTRTGCGDSEWMSQLSPAMGCNASDAWCG